MTADPRLALDVDEADGQVRIRLRAAADIQFSEEEPVLLRATVGELLGLARAPEAFREALLDPRRRLLVANGWQSWSYAGELGPRERVKACLVGRFRPFSQRPGRLERRGELLSHFYVGLRAGEGRLFLVSRNAGTPPLSFRLDRRSLDLSVEALAGGAAFKAGQAVAELRLFWREGFFEARDAFREAFAEFGTFERLSFLGKGEALVPGGYESWYNHYTDISEAVIEGDLEAIDAEPNLIRDFYIERGKPTVFQIDDGWERAVGEWDVDEGKFPRGLSRLAGRAEEKGLVPGLWLAPFLATKRSAVYRDHPDWILRGRGGKPVPAGWNPNWDGDFYALDLSVPEVGDYLDAVFERVVEEWGFRYLKLDFLYAAFTPGVRRGGGAAYVHYDRIVGRITSKIEDGRGRPVAWLGCGAPLEPSFSHFPLMRIGADTKEAWDWPILKAVRHEGRPAAYANLLATFGRAVLDGSVFVNDPDVIFLRSRGMALSEAEKELVALADFLLASQIMFSDNVSDFRDPAARAFSERIVALFDRLEEGEYGAERIARDVFSVFRRGGGVRGVANLSERPWSAPSGLHDRGRPILERASRSGGRTAFAARSISLYEE